MSWTVAVGARPRSRPHTRRAEIAGARELERWLCDPSNQGPDIEEVARVFDVHFEARSPAEADAIALRLRLALAVLRDVFPTDDAIRRWLRGPKLELGGERPLDLLLAGRAERLEVCAIREWNRATRVFTLFWRRLMSVKPIPDGYHTVTPAIIVRGAKRAIEFYKRAFGAEEVTRMEGPDGSVMHAEIRIGDSVVMLGDENEQYGTRSPLSTNGTPGSLHLYVDDVDAVFARAVSEGAKVRMPIENAFWGDRYGKVTDPFGHEWGLATHIRDMTEDEVKQAAEQWMAQAGQQAGGQERHEEARA